MSLQSMTGFAREEGQHDQTGWVWELRSVNGKGLDIRIRLPHGFEAIESLARSLIAADFKRGNIQVSLQIMQAGGGAVPVINAPALAAVLAVAKTLQKQIGGALPSTGELLALKGIIETSEPQLDSKTREKRDQALLDGLKKAVVALARMRVREGTAITGLASGHIKKIAELRDAIQKNDARQPAAIKKQLAAQIAKIMESSDGLDSQRLHQEAVILAAKADLQEELDRLKVHIAAARQLLREEGPAGRKLDFIAQEFNRECNTICSKSNASGITLLGLDMKLAIDQFREQLQNLE